MATDAENERYKNFLGKEKAKVRAQNKQPVVPSSSRPVSQPIPSKPKQQQPNDPIKHNNNHNGNNSPSSKGNRLPRPPSRLGALGLPLDLWRSLGPQRRLGRSAVGPRILRARWKGWGTSITCALLWIL